MSAYFFTAEVTQSQIRLALGHFDQTVAHLETWDSCATLIVYGGTRDEAQKQFEKWVSSGAGQDKPIQTETKRIFIAPMVEQFFTEYGHEPIDWSQISGKADASLKRAEVDDASTLNGLLFMERFFPTSSSEANLWVTRVAAIKHPG